MKTLLVLAALVTLVGLGVWNSPKAAHDEGYSVVRTMKLTGEALTISSVIVDEAIVYEPVKAEAIPWAEYDAGVKNADEIAKQQTEWAVFQSVAKTPSVSDDFSDYSPLPSDPIIAIHETEDGRSAELEITE